MTDKTLPDIYDQTSLIHSFDIMINQNDKLNYEEKIECLEFTLSRIKRLYREDQLLNAPVATR